MQYEITVTLGPGSEAETTWEALAASGATAFRLNTSHLSVEQIRSWLDRLKAFQRTPVQRLPVVLDLQGSKWRLGQFSAFALVKDQLVELIYAGATQQNNRLPVPHRDFFKAAPGSDGEIVLNDARIRLEMESCAEASIRARVTLGGTISPHKGITFSASEYRREALSEKD